MEIKISKLAEDKIIENALAYNTEPLVRIYADKVSCSAARFAIAFDNKREGDIETKVGKINVLTDTKYIPQYSDGISIDYATSPKEGFLITSLKPCKSGCGSCGGCSGCGGKGNC